MESDQSKPAKKPEEAKVAKIAKLTKEDLEAKAAQRAKAIEEAKAAKDTKAAREAQLAKAAQASKALEEAKAIKEAKAAKWSWMTRRRVMGVLLGGGAACVANAFIIEPRWLKVTRTQIHCPELSEGLDGLRVGVLGDIHYQPGRMDGLLERAIDELLEEKPDMIMMPGDFVDIRGTELAPMMKAFSRLKAEHGVYASMGNHDGWTESGFELRDGFEKLGIKLLINQHVLLHVKGGILAVAATDHVWLGNPAPQRTFAGLPPQVPVIAMVHEPDFFDEMTQARPIALQISGHTHGGQCRVPFIGYAPLLPKYGKNYVRGVYEKGDSRLFVTSGLGTTGPPARFACRPEVAILTLRARKADRSNG